MIYHSMIFSNIYLGSPTPSPSISFSPTAASVKRAIDEVSVYINSDNNNNNVSFQKDFWTYNPTTERSVVKSYNPFQSPVSWHN
jgi:hypothetical protein